jgi:hypothetical protein
MQTRAKFRCVRCSGCGRVEVMGREERAWGEFRNMPPHKALEKVLGMRAPRTCPDCHGTGYLPGEPSNFPLS